MVPTELLTASVHSTSDLDVNFNFLYNKLMHVASESKTGESEVEALLMSAVSDVSAKGEALRLR
jgi:hypothetical protein